MQTKTGKHKWTNLTDSRKYSKIEAYQYRKGKNYEVTNIRKPTTSSS